MAVPTCPTADFILIQANFPLGRLEAALNGPPRARHPHDCRQGGLLGGKDHRRSQLRRGAVTTPDQQPAPVIPPRTFRAIARTELRPAVLWQDGQDRVDLTWSPAQTDGLLARDGQD